MCRKLIYLVSFVLVLGVAARTFADWSDDFSEDPQIIIASGQNQATLNQDSAAGFYTSENAAGIATFGWVPEGYITNVGGHNRLRGFGYLVDAGPNPGQIAPGTYEFTANLTWEVNSHFTLVDVYVLSGSWTVGFRAGETEPSEEGIRAVVPTNDAALAMKVGSLFFPDGTPSTEESPVDITIPNVVVTEGSKVLMFCYFYSFLDHGLRMNSMALKRAGAATLAGILQPADGTTDVVRDVVVLEWTPGEYADKHDVYFGNSFEDVNTATTASPEYKGNQTKTTYALDHLELGQTYYWRIDEVNAPPDLTIFKGDVWSFTVEPIAYPIVDVNATASSSNSAGEGPENTVNGSGLDADDTHLEEPKTMWLSSVVDPNAPWIHYEFDRVYKLHQMWVWNHNTLTESVIGFGIKEATIEYSADGNDWTALGDFEFARAPGAAGYESNTTVDLSGVVAKYVKITANSNWGGFVPQYGLSEVRFFYLPVVAREPNPASGTTDMDVDNVTLSWRAGREAASHQVHLSDSNQAVIDGTALVATVSETSYDTGELQLNQSYYWKVNEVNEAEAPATWEGDVLNFMTREFLVVDDFEDYTNFSPDRVFQRWIDGIGYSADEFFPVENPGNGTGAALGHDIWSYDSPHYDGDIMETAIVHGGVQSAPLYYDNSIAPFTSEIVRTFDVPQDWTKHGIKTLTLYFYGDPNNVAQQMYVKVNGTKVLYDGEAANITRIPWQAWNIELADLVGVNLSNVTELSIGLESIGAVGGTGVVYFDDIRLYPHSRQLITPAEPSNVGLVAHYEFEGTANDSSGNGLHGTAVGDPIFVVGNVGQAISLDGIGDYVEITSYKGILGPNAVTVTAWINTTATETGAIIGWGSNVGGQRFGFRIDDGRLRTEHHGGNIQGDTNVNNGGWHHVAVTVQENATISYPEVVLYLNGIDDTRPSTDPDAYNITADLDVSIGRRPASDDRYFMGLIDDVRIYERVLSPDEISWLAGRTQPFDKPF